MSTNIMRFASPPGSHPYTMSPVRRNVRKRSKSRDVMVSIELFFI
jgi:hypothetical protein